MKQEIIRMQCVVCGRVENIREGEPEEEHTIRIVYSGNSTKSIEVCDFCQKSYGGTVEPLGADI